MKIDGREIAKHIFEDLEKKIEDLKKKNITPHLVIVLIGEDPASISYVNSKKEKGEKIGCKVTILNLKSDIAAQELFKLIEEYNNISTVHGIIVQRPVPSQIPEYELDLAIVPKKDVDGFNPNSPFDPPIAEAVLEILKSIKVEPKGKKICVIGKGKTGGGPIIQVLKKNGVEPQVVDSKTPNSSDLTLGSDIIITAVGKSHVLKSENIKKGAILVSLGMHKEEDGKLHGDYDESEIEEKAKFYTPTPGGVGPVNVACLLKNLITASKNSS